MKHPITRAKRVSKRFNGMKMMGQLDTLIEKSRAQVMDFEAIPLEQLKGDIMRAGHQVERALALDPDGRRLFFMDENGQSLFAEFGPPSDNYSVERIAPQSLIAKEYNVIDLEPSVEVGNPGENIVTTHSEAENEDWVGIVPSGTPGDKPEDNDRGYGSEEKQPARMDNVPGSVGSSVVSVIKQLEEYIGEEEKCK